MSVIRYKFVILAILLFSAVLATTACTKQTLPAMESSKVTELIKNDIKVGEGKEAVAGQQVKVHYTGWLFDEAAPENKGKKFDSSLDRKDPFDFSLGAGDVIKGWDEGVQGMRVGGLRTLIIPANKGYGSRGAGGVIPPNATLVFDVELLGVK